MGAAATPLMVAGGLLNLVGAGVTAKGQLDSGDAALAAAKTNAQRMRTTAASVEDVARQDAARVRGEASQVIGQQRAAFGASGIDASVGSAANLAAYSRQQAELDALRLKNNAAREAWGIRTQAQEVLRQGRMEKKNSRVAAVGTIMGGLSGSAQSFYGASKT